ncbi:hypothetical protein EDC94DRAFT_628355 [Helicostylum pulchrum]|nr:hypothetical protein EDC94DRAFT_628355 [Helicostylum pulchrum]
MSEVAKRPRKTSKKKSKDLHKSLTKDNNNGLQEHPQQQQPQQQSSGSSSKMPAIRLDLNLDAELYIKAKAQGDVTLTILS